MKAIEEINFQAYLESVLNDKAYSDCRHCYTPTDGAIRPNLDLRVKRYQSPRTEAGQESKTKEVLSVLDGLRKYQSEHVLLVGKPGSGKSTALEKLLLDEAQKAKSDSQVKISVLVRLRQYQTSVLDLVRDFLMGHGFSEIGQLEQLLLEGRFLLLLDGVNELPSQTARTDLENFRVRYRKFTPMILTTRDLSFGGTVGVEHKLEMEPLTVPQMNEFVQGYLPDQHKQMLQQMGDRLQQFAETPLLLVMLCDVFKKHQKISTNLGEAFRDFTQIYDTELREKNVPTFENSQVVWSEVLQHLAFFMMQGSSVTELNLRITKQKAIELIQEKFRKSYDQAFLWLEDLLRYHLIQEFRRDQVEFRHQLIQEYYAAEYLLKNLDGLAEDELKQKYLNYLKWTEPLALMIGLEKKSVKVIEIIKIALEVDLKLGARLAGEAQQEFHPQTIKLLKKLEIPDWFKISLLGETKSSEVIEIITQAFAKQDVSQSWFAVLALYKIGKPEKIFKPLVEALKNPDEAVHGLATMMLRGIVDEQLSDDLLSILCESPDSKLKERVIAILVQSPSDMLFNTLQTIVHDSDQESALRQRVIAALRQVGNERAVEPLQKLLKNIDLNIRASVVATLANIKHESVVNPLISVLDDRSENHNFRRTAAETLAEMRIPQAFELMQEILLDITDNLELRQALPRQLGQYGSDKVVQSLLQVSGNLQEELWLRISSVDALGVIRSQQTVKILKEIVSAQDEDSNLRSRAAISLARINKDKIFEFLLNIIEDKNEDLEFRGQIIHVLEWLAADCRVINKLQDFLLDHSNSSELRRRAAYTLRCSNSLKTENILIQILKDPSSIVVSSSVHALRELRSHAASSALIELLKHDDCIVRQDAAYALGSISSMEAISELINLLQDKDLAVNKAVIFALTQIGGQEVANALLQVLPTLQDYSMLYRPVVHALGQGESEVVTEPLLQAFMAADSGHKYISGEILGKVATADFLPRMVSLIPEAEVDALEVISAIQNRYKFYNYNLTLSKHCIAKPYMEQKSILRIVVASPSDVQAERDLLPVVIDELNMGIASDRNLSIELVRWETDSFPGFHAEGSQGLIDSVLKIEDCDILIGIFWKRFGTPVMDANSGTEHEFLTAYEAWKQESSPQIMVYFNQKPYNPSSSKESEQWTQVLKFKENFPEEGLWWKYEGEADFERKVRNHLTQFIRKYHPNTEPSSTLPVAANIPSSNQPITYDFRGATIGNLAHNVQGNQHST